MKLYSYFRSSASYRVRIALALKGLSYEYVPVHLVKNEQLASVPRASRRRSSCRPVLDEPATTPLTQSLAIIEYLDETHPEPPLLPADALGRARVRALALDIACEIHPLDNLRVLRYLVKDLGVSRGRQEPLVPALGRDRPRDGRAPARRQRAPPDATATATRRRSPTACSCRRSSTPSAWIAALDHVPTVMRVFERCMARAAFSTTQASACPDAA